MRLRKSCSSITNGMISGTVVTKVCTGLHPKYKDMPNSEAFMLLLRSKSLSSSSLFTLNTKLEASETQSVFYYSDPDVIIKPNALHSVSH